LICGSSFRCCCSILPDIKESTSTRLMYALFLFASTFVCVIMMSPYLLADILFAVIIFLYQIFNWILRFLTLLLFIFKFPTSPEYTDNLTNPNVYYATSPEIQQKEMSSVCEDEDIGGPNCPLYSGPIAVYRLSIAMASFFFVHMILTIGVSTSRSIRGLIHNGYLNIRIS
jgi:hypothetical protein